MTHPIHRPSSFNRLLPLVSLSLFAAAMWALHDALRQFRYHHILTQLQNVSASHVLAAVGLTVLSYLVMTGYDQLAITYIRHPLNVVKVILASFISYAFSNTIGLSLLTSGSIRYRLYSAWGLSAEEIARLVVFTTVTFWSGIVTVAGMLFIVEPMAMPIPLQTVILPARLVGLFCVILVIMYLIIVSLRKRPFRFRNWELTIPSPRLAGAQLLVGSLDWVLAGSVLFVLLPEPATLSFVQFLDIYLLAQIVALISHVPGGLGVFESMILLSAPQIPADALLGSMLIYRGVYYLLPLTLAALVMAGNEIFEKKSQIKRTVIQVDRWWGVSDTASAGGRHADQWRGSAVFRGRSDGTRPPVPTLRNSFPASDRGISFPR